MALCGARAHGAALETQVSTDLYYYASDPEKVTRAQTESGLDGLKFVAPRPARDIAEDNAREEVRQGNVCLRQLRSDLHVSAKKWKIRDLCEKVFHDGVEHAVQDAAKQGLHPDHVECSASAEAREEAGEITLDLSLRAELVMRDRAPLKLRHAGIGGELTRWELPPMSDRLGSAAGSWKDALKAGACAADEKALQKFWDRVQRHAAEIRELAECRTERARDVQGIERLQKQLRDYVPEEWIEERAGKDAATLLTPPTGEDDGTLAACKTALADTSKLYDKVEDLSNRIAEKYEVPALGAGAKAGRSPASVTEEEGD